MAVMDDQIIATSEVLLRDFDGTRTIYLSKLPLPELISCDSAEEGIAVRRRYGKTDQRDESERTIYEECN